MIQYIYFVKCPNCEDEHFDFFDEAKGFAMGCLSKKPIITQTEVNRNDFGECTDHCDLGTVWSWEDAVGKETEEPGTNVFSKGDFGKYNPDNDPEFADDDFFAVNKAVESEIDPISTVEDAVDFLVKDEEEAIAGYEKIADVVKNFDAENKEEILDTIDHIKEEEEEHIEELEALLAEEEAELVEHINEEHPAIESEQELAGIDNAVVDCKAAKVISHSEDEKPVDCEGKKKPLEKPLIEGFTFSLNNEKDLAEFTKLCQEVGIRTIGDLDLFTKESANEPGNILDKLRAYRAELGPDFKIKEAYTDPETECIYNDNIECTNNEDCADCPNNPKNTVYSGKTLKELVEEMEENEDEVECTWCNDLFPKDICKKEVNLGYLCPRCADGIISRGETLTFKENNYWDFLDEKFDTDFEDEASSDSLDYESDCLDTNEVFHVEEKLCNESFDYKDKVDLEYDALTITVYGARRDADDWDESEHTGSYTYEVAKGDVADTIWENFITEDDVTDVAGGLEALEDNDTWHKFLEGHFDALFEKYYDKVLAYYEDDAKEEYQEHYED